MAEPHHKEGPPPFFQNVCVLLVATLKALSLYPSEHPEASKKLTAFFDALEKYLSQHPSLTILFLDGTIVVENTRHPELSEKLSRFLQMTEALNLQRLMFRQGLSSAELLRFLQLLRALLKNPTDGELVLAKNQERLPHIVAGRLPFDGLPQASLKEATTAFQAMRESAQSFSAQLKDVFADVQGALAKNKVNMAKNATAVLFKMITSGELPLKTLLYHRSADPDACAHAMHVCAIAMTLSHYLGVNQAAVGKIGLGALLHDIGLYSDSSEQLSTSTLITLNEKKRLREHPVRGAEMLLASPGMPELAPIIAYEHHLHYKGGGYPEQRRSRDLNLASLIAGVADAYDNLRRNRPGEKALSLSEALNWMENKKGLQFHPLVLNGFRGLVRAQVQDKA
jgi:putative nucleotidyltransferase with HDIG domain